MYACMFVNMYMWCGMACHGMVWNVCMYTAWLGTLFCERPPSPEGLAAGAPFERAAGLALRMFDGSKGCPRIRVRMFF